MCTDVSVKDWSDSPLAKERVEKDRVTVRGSSVSPLPRSFLPMWTHVSVQVTERRQHQVTRSR